MMRPDVLLQTQKLVSVTPITIRMSTTIQSGSPRSRVVLPVEAFNLWYNPGRDGIAPRSDTFGNAADGLIVLLNAKGANKVDQINRASVYINYNVRPNNGAQQRVSTQPLDAVIAEYEGGTKALLIGPLPNAFIPTSARVAREKSPNNLNIPKVISDAFKAAGLNVHAYRGNAQTLNPALEALIEEDTSVDDVVPNPVNTQPAFVHDKPAVAPETVEPETPQSSSVTAESTHDELLYRVKNGVAGLSDIIELIKMLNNEVDRFHTSGSGALLFHVDDQGHIRAKADVRVKLDI